jgi:N-acyl-D-amino-acid deacylase
MVVPDDSWENMYLGAGRPDGALVLPAAGPFRQFTGQRLSQVAAELGADPLEAVARLVESAPPARDVECAFFSMSEDNVEKVMRLGWVSLGSDAGSGAAEPPRSSQPGLAGWGRLAEGCFADVVVFDPDAIADPATYEDPHQYATGVRAVLVNGSVAVRGRTSPPASGRRAASSPAVLPAATCDATGRADALAPAVRITSLPNRR